MNPQKPGDEAEAFLPPVDPKSTDVVEVGDYVMQKAARFRIWSQVAPTSMEKKVWGVLGKTRNPWGFKPQVYQHGYLLDFYSEPHRLAIEADGPDHLKRLDEDRYRDKVLREYGIRTLRFTPRDLRLLNKHAIVGIIETLILPENKIKAVK